MTVLAKRAVIASFLLLTGCSCNCLPTVQVSESAVQPSPLAVPSLQEVSDEVIAQPIPLKETLIVPGERVGPVTQTTNRPELAKMFGEKHLSDRTLSDPEGIDTLPATTVNLGPEQSFTVVWADATRTKPVYVRELGSDWKTSEGIGVGTSFAKLYKQLGEFQLYGLDWDYGGSIALQGTKLSRYQGKLILQVNAAPNAAATFPKDYRAVTGDRQFSSKTPTGNAWECTWENSPLYLITAVSNLQRICASVGIGPHYAIQLKRPVLPIRRSSSLLLFICLLLPLASCANSSLGKGCSDR